MRVVRKINNNVAVGIDGNNREVVLFGKGIGFETMPYDLNDLSKIDRTYYDIDEKFYNLFNEIDTEFFSYIDHLVDVVKSKISGNWDSYLTVILADHISFSLQRIKNGTRIDFPYSYDIEYEYPDINNAATWIVKKINERMNVHLEKGEITCIAMHLLAAMEGKKKSESETKIQKGARILKTITTIIEEYYEIKINKKDLNYYRFRNHIQFFVKRKELNERIKDDNAKLFEDMIQKYPQTYECVLKIGEFLFQEYKEPCSKDELLYLMIHINRLNSRGGL